MSQQKSATDRNYLGKRSQNFANGGKSRNFTYLVRIAGTAQVTYVLR
ncbi:MAG TPA: hypothetical protein V6C93_20420 [Allocoleopsis sp.]